jgi:catechol 2,3-dioxygenase-like lactoylglutathione lyase family enzyme
MTDTNTEALIRPGTGTALLAGADAVANLAVADLAEARAFYEGLLGFAQVDEEDGELIVYKSGSTVFNVYRSDYAGTNQATAMTWTVGDRVEQVVEALAAKGITFEHYDWPGMRREGDVHIAGDMKVAWFKDPDGNILNVASG